MKSHFLQYFPYESLDLKNPNIEISIQISRKNDLETNPKNKRICKILELKNLIYAGPQITPKSDKIL